MLQAETAQQWFPKLLLSDYEESIETALGLLPVPYAKALNGQEGLTTETLGGIDDDRPESQGGYDPGLRTCWTVWHKAYPQVPPGNQEDYIEEQGPIAGWCQVIALFATAATKAGSDLNRRTFVTAMSKITNFPGTYTPVLSYGPDKRYGPVQYQVVKLHINSPASSQCHMPKDRIPQFTCWVTVSPGCLCPPADRRPSRSRRDPALVYRSDGRADPRRGAEGPLARGGLVRAGAPLRRPPMWRPPARRAPGPVPHG